MNQLITYLRENVLLDFQGELTVDAVREFLKGDNSAEARTLLAKVVADGDTNDMLLVLADCLVDAVKKSLSPEIVRAQLRNYADS